MLELKNLPDKPSPQHIARHLTTLIKHNKNKSNSAAAVSPLWILAAPLIQLPIFITTMATVRHMSLSNWPGFSTGGALWFTDLTLPAVKLSQIVELDTTTTSSSSGGAVNEAIIVNMTPMGIAGIILPACILLFTFTTIQTNFKSGSGDQITTDSKTAASKSMMMTDVFRSVFEVALIPVSLITLFLPQGTLCYWASSSSLALLQSRVMKNSLLRGALGVVPPPIDRTLTAGQIEVLNKAAQLKAKGQHMQGIEILVPLLKQSNNHPRVLFALGTMHSALGEWQQAAVCFVKSAESHDDVYLQARAWLAAVPGLLSGNEKELERAEMALKRAKMVLKADADRKMIGELEQVLYLERQKEKERRGG
jgi:membrane protein insertase Oxa1/YidC/SpoIIIJ